MSKHIIRIGTFLKFLLVFVIIIGGTIALVAYGQGYIYDREQGIVGGGLVLLNTEPRNATVSVDGVTLGGTPRRVRRPAGSYDISMSLDGYRPWQKKVEVEEGGLVHAEYPFLIPNDVNTTGLHALGEPTLFSLSPDGLTLLYQEASNPAALQLTSTRDHTETAELDLDELGLEGFAVTEIAWSAADMLLVIARGDEQDAFALFDVDGVEADLVAVDTIDQESVLKLSPDGELFGLVGQEFGRYIPSQESFTTIAANVIGFAAGEEVYFMNDEYEIARRSDPEVALYQMGRDGAYDLEFLSYRNERLLVVRELASGRVTLLDAEEGFASRTLPFVASDELSFSPHQRFIVSRNGRLAKTYDIRTEDIHAFSLPDTPPSTLAWFGSHHLLMSANGNSTIMEFDGGNREFITSDAGFGVHGARNDRRIYSIGQNSITGRFILQRSILE